MYHVYALFSKSHGRFYIGLTSDLNRRLKEHNSAEVKSTKHHLPWLLFHAEEFATRLEARNREKRLKTSFGRKYLKEVLNKKRL